MTTQLRTLRSAQSQREALPAGALRVFEVEYQEVGVRRVRMSAKSEAALRCDLERSHPEWFPVSIVEVKP